MMRQSYSKHAGSPRTHSKTHTTCTRPRLPSSGSSPVFPIFDPKASPGTGMEPTLKPLEVNVCLLCTLWQMHDDTFALHNSSYRSIQIDRSICIDLGAGSTTLLLRLGSASCCHLLTVDIASSSGKSNALRWDLALNGDSIQLAPTTLSLLQVASDTSANGLSPSCSINSRQ